MPRNCRSKLGLPKQIPADMLRFSKETIARIEAGKPSGSNPVFGTVWRAAPELRLPGS